MAISEAGIHHRTAEHAAADKQTAIDNLGNEAWKDWPNEACVSIVFLTVINAC